MEGLVGQEIKGYELRERIGAGGFGAVYKAYQSTVGREVAIKIILPGFTNHPDFVRRFESEAQLVARLEHLHIAPLYDYWRDPGGAYLVMRYLRGGSLRNVLKQGPYNLEETATLLDQVTSALSVAHGHGVVHRDIKPENILLDEDGNAYLADFGIAKEFGIRTTKLTDDNAIVGSPDYLAPEQARSEPVTTKTDIYSLGIVLFEMLTGEHPFPDLSPVERLFKHINDSVPEITSLDKEVSKAVNAVVQKATAKDPELRFDNAGMLASEFREAAGLSPTQSARQLVELLTPREQEVLKLIVDGKSNREIAEKLTVEMATVKWYINRIYKKLNVRSRVQAIIRARELNLIVDGRVTTIATTGLATSVAEAENPYKGLKPFQIGDEREFYGREQLTDKVVERLAEEGDHARFLAIVGPSGSGKSSLVRAGLIPAIWRGALAGSESWFIVDMIPGTHPLEELEVALLKVASEHPPNLLEHLKRGGRGLHRAAQLILPDDESQLLLVIDQFEEVFTLVESEEERSLLLDLIVGAVSEKRSRVRVVVTLRADFYDRPLQYPAFGELVQERIETVLPLSAEELERAIARPAEGVGVKFEEGLVASIIQDVHYQAGALPLMQYALTELFDARSDLRLTHDAYVEIGGSTGALAKRADDLYQELEADARGAVKQMFLRLVTLGEVGEDTRRRATRSELLAVGDDPDRVDELIDLYTSSRLISTDIDHATRSPTVELAHEAILAEWPRLQDWLDDSREDIRLQRALASAATDWREAGQDPSFLLRGTRLGQFENWSERSSLVLTTKEYEFLEASVEISRSEERERKEQIERELAAARTIRRRAFYLAGALVVSVGLAIAAITFAQSASRSADLAGQSLQAAEAANTQLVAESIIRATAEAAAVEQRAEAELQADIARSREFASAAIESLATDPELSVLLALEALDVAETEQGTSALHRSLQALRLERVMGGSEFGQALALAHSPDGSIVAVGTEGGRVRLWDRVSEKELASWDGHADRINDMDFSPDGAVLATAGEDYMVKLWEVEASLAAGSGVELGRLNGHSDWVAAVDFSPDGSRLATGSGDGTAVLWDRDSLSLVRVFNANDRPVQAVAFDRSGDHLVTGHGERLTVGGGAGGEDGLARIWDIASGLELSSISTNNPTVIELDFATDEGALYVAEFDGSVRAHKLDVKTGLPTGEQIALPATCPIGGDPKLDSSPDGRLLVVGCNDGRLHVIETTRFTTSFVLSGAGGPANEVSFNPNCSGRPSSPFGLCPMQLASAHFDGTVRIWNLGRSGQRELLTVPGIMGVFAPGETKFRTVEGSVTFSGFSNFTDHMWGLPSIQDAASTNPDGWDYEYLGAPYEDTLLWVGNVSPNRELIAWTGFETPTLYIQDALTANPVTSFEIPPYEGNRVTYLAFSPDNERILTAGYEAGVRVWSSASGDEILSLGGPVKEADGAIFSPNGALIATNHIDNKTRLWDSYTGEFLRELEGHADGVLSSVFNPNSNLLATASLDTTVRLWNVETGEEVRAFSGFTGSVWQVQFSPDGSILVGGSNDGLIKLWDVETGRELATLSEPDGAFLFGFEFTSDGRYLASSDLTNRTRVFVVQLEDLKALARTRVTRSLTPEECRQYLHLEACP